ncbi:uncharacterized protein LOC132713473 [Ruditapes philippinarum]|uniref:uncharacterized protein LOC132713473 n=1 Tax=Ruditapes philippinarum TaxID=129788 RepID=UPI00295BA6B3|nr:uncharacterized protein LOC132713473 [Ruditapes philippinarum]
MTHTVRYTTKCIGEYACNGEIQRYRDLVSLLIGKRQTAFKRNNLEIGGSCIVQCCKSDLCNINCKENVTPTSTAATIASSSTSTMESTHHISLCPILTLSIKTTHKKYKGFFPNKPPKTLK